MKYTETLRETSSLLRLTVSLQLAYFTDHCITLVCGVGYDFLINSITIVFMAVVNI